MDHNLRASILLCTLTACGPVIADDLAPLPALTDDTAASSGSTSSSSTGGDSIGNGSTSEGADGSASSAASTSSGSTGGGPVDSTGVGSTGAEGSDTGEIPAASCFGDPCSDEIPCGDGLACLDNPNGGPAVCGMSDCAAGEPCDGSVWGCSKAPQGECIENNTGHGWCHPRACKDGTCGGTGECIDGLCY